MQKRILRILKNLCYKYGITCLMVNHIVRWDGEIKISLGRKWRANKAISHRIRLTRLFEVNQHYLEIDEVF